MYCYIYRYRKDKFRRLECTMNIDVKETLKKLHQVFPKMSLDDLFKILDCFVSEYTWENLNTTTKVALYTTDITSYPKTNGKPFYVDSTTGYKPEIYYFSTPNVGGSGKIETTGFSQCI